MTEYCEREGCGEILSFDGLAGMGSFHSNYYKCKKCGNIYRIYDIHSFPTSLVSEGMRCIHEDPPLYNGICKWWGCPRTHSKTINNVFYGGWIKREYYRFHKNCEFMVSWDDKNPKPKQSIEQPLTHLEKNALRITEL